MKVYYTCSTAEFAKYEKYYTSIRNFLVVEKHILTKDWMDEAQERIQSGRIEIPNIKEIYNDCIRAIQEADVVIIEDSVSNFSTGHQITVALQRQKPTLVLWATPKHRHFKQTFIQGIESEYLEVAEYNLENYKDIIRSFVKKYENAHQKNRFHLVLDEVERKYLDWAQFVKGKSRTKLIRESLRNEINKDEEYQKYLRG